jgi:hypothetical protein
MKYNSYSNSETFRLDISKLNIQKRSAWDIAQKHCSSFEKYTYLIQDWALIKSKINKHYSMKKNDIIFEFICSSEVLYKAPSFAIVGTEIDPGWCDNSLNSKCEIIASF